MNSINYSKISEIVDRLKNDLESYCTGGNVGGDEFNLRYSESRKLLISNSEIKSLIPLFLKDCRNPQEFWSFIKPKLKTYAERRDFLKTEFNRLRQFLEEKLFEPVHGIANDMVIRTFDEDEIYEIWKKTTTRLNTDVEGTLTSARTLLEAVCKHILENLKIEFNDSADLPILYGLTSKALNLAPSQHTETIYKQILGGCHSVVQGLGSVRSKLGDAHGKGKSAPKASYRHGELSVNLSGAMAIFLIRTYKAKSEKET